MSDTESPPPGWEAPAPSTPPMTPTDLLSTAGHVAVVLVTLALVAAVLYARANGR